MGVKTRFDIISQKKDRLCKKKSSLIGAIQW